MSAYIIAHVEVSDPEQYRHYIAQASRAIAEFGARPLVRGGQSKTLEGSWQPQRLVVLEFPSWEQAENFYNSPSYTLARELRENAATMNMVLVAGAE